MANTLNVSHTVVGVTDKFILLTNVNIPEHLLDIHTLPDIVSRIKRLIEKYYSPSSQTTFEVTGSYELVFKGQVSTIWKGSFRPRDPKVPCIQEFIAVTNGFVANLTALLSNRHYIEQKLRSVKNKDTQFEFVRLISIIINIQGYISKNHFSVVELGLKYPKKYGRRNIVTYPLY